MSNAFAWVFLAALAAATVTRLWLAQRQMRHVRAHREAVPATFAAVIPLASHQKAADYTVAKARLGMIDVMLGAVVLLALTLGGGIQLLSDAWARAFASGSIAHGTALILSVVFLQSLIGMPLALYRTFVLEQRFGFNRMTVRLVLTDLVKQTLIGLVLGVPLLLAVLWLMERMGPLWWLYVWIVWPAFSLVLMMVYPAYILPLFNKFTPLAEGEV